MNLAKTFRLFISSTFSDFRRERQVLQEKVFPTIEKYLKEKHPLYTFQAIDLRWGVSEEAQFDQKTLDLCLSQVRTCKHYLHPNFLIMSGNRYGWIPLPYAIEEEEFNKLKEKIEHKQSTDYAKLLSWYQLDNNHVPISYILKERKGAYKEYDIWVEEEDALRKIFQETLFDEKDKEENRKFFISATEAEVEEGIFPYFEPTPMQNLLKNNGINLPILDKEDIFGFTRDIECGKSIDCTEEPYTSFIDDNQENVSNFRKELEKTGIEISNKKVSFINSSDIAFENEEEYLNQFEIYVTKKLIQSIEKQIMYQKEIITDVNTQEILEQKAFRNKKIKIFEGREQELEEVKKYINQTTSQPFLIHGVSGITPILKKANRNKVLYYVKNEIEKNANKIKREIISKAFNKRIRRKS